MGLFGTMFTGYSGLFSDIIAMDVTADNISNLNSIGFKRSRTEFMDILIGSNEIFCSEKGCGTAVKNIKTLFTQGSIQTTDIPTDLAIIGKGFFPVIDKEGNIFYTRDGQFFINEADETHYALQNSLEMYLLGADPDAIQVTFGDLKPELIPKIIPAKATSVIEAQLIFDSRKPTNSNNLLEKYNANNLEEPLEEGYYQWAWEFPVYDPMGNEIYLKLYTDKTENFNEYEILLTLADPSLDGRGDGKLKGAFLYGKLCFGDTGLIESAEFYEIPSPDANINNLPELDLTKIGKPKFTLNVQGRTQEITLDLGFEVNPDGSYTLYTDSSKFLAQSFAQLFYTQDGYPLGMFDRVEVITENGLIKAWYTNGKDIEVAKIFLADFTGYEDTLTRVGKNLFVSNSDPIFFSPGIDERGKVLSGALEGSNVDLAYEMLNLIVLQRAFQSNAKVITTADQILEEFLRYA